MTPFGDDFHDSKTDSCMECGFCEHVCPSRYVTLTPRQRIQSRRIIKAMAGSDLAKKLESDYEYQGRDTCAADGMCQQACPVGINTADLTDRIREATLSPQFSKILTSSARNFKRVEQVMKGSLHLAVDVEGVISAKPLEWALSLAHDISNQFPHWSKSYPKPPKFIPQEAKTPDFIYFPACVTRIFGVKESGKDNLMEVIKRLAQKAGLALTLPEDAQGLCCSQIWQHKGDMEGARIMANKIIEHFWIWSRGGLIPIVCDTTSCSHTLLVKMVGDADECLLEPANVANYKKIKILDITQWLKDAVVPKLKFINKKRRVLLHPTCACEELHLTSVLTDIAKCCATEVVVPDFWGCCGASGDRGFIYPELGESATRDERREVENEQFDGRYSLARTCEINLQDFMHNPFESIAYLVDETT